MRTVTVFSIKMAYFNLASSKRIAKHTKPVDSYEFKMKFNMLPNILIYIFSLCFATQMTPFFNDSLYFWQLFMQTGIADDVLSTILMFEH